ncbi:MAG TPA: hypothetical protein VJX67_06875 [Blastocatellia bacterium]|nr:hypothetical protein [Blastocatellia bacterium]
MESKPNQAKARMVVVVIFALGFVGGGLSMNLYERARTAAPSNNDHRGKEYYMEQLNERLKLTTDQQQKIHAILNDASTQFADKIKVCRQQSRDKIRAVLSPEQLPKFEQMVQEHDKERAQKSEHKE